MELENNVIRFESKNKSIKEEFILSFNENRQSLYRLASTILKRKEDIEDAISETILKAYSNYFKLRDKAKFKGWIFKILVNECYIIIRKNKKYYLSEDFSKYDNGYEENNDEGLMHYVNKLDRDFRDVVVLFYYEGMSVKEISEILGVREGTVKSRLSRARSKLKIIMENEEDI